MKNKQIKLSSEEKERNKEFMKTLFTTDIPNHRAYFERNADNKPGLRKDNDMGLEIFLDNFNYVTGVTLDIGIIMLPDHIRFCASGNLLGNISYAWFNCSLNKSNLEKINETFTLAYGCDLVAIKHVQQLESLNVKVYEQDIQDAKCYVTLKAPREISVNEMLKQFKFYLQERLGVKRIDHLKLDYKHKIENVLLYNGFIYIGDTGEINTVENNENLANFLVMMHGMKEINDPDLNYKVNKLNIFCPIGMKYPRKEQMTELLHDYQLQMNRSSERSFEIL